MLSGDKGMSCAPGLHGGLPHSMGMSMPTQTIAHLVGKFSHDKEFGDHPQHYACPECDTPMNAPGPQGQDRMWILEIHLLQKPSVGT